MDRDDKDALCVLACGRHFLAYFTVAAARSVSMNCAAFCCWSAWIKRG
jgi:hypothetical protein